MTGKVPGLNKEQHLNRNPGAAHLERKLKGQRTASTPPGNPIRWLRLHTQNLPNNVASGLTGSIGSAIGALGNHHAQNWLVPAQFVGERAHAQGRENNEERWLRPGLSYWND